MTLKSRKRQKSPDLVAAGPEPQGDPRAALVPAVKMKREEDLVKAKEAVVAAIDNLPEEVASTPRL